MMPLICFFLSFFLPEEELKSGLRVGMRERHVLSAACLLAYIFFCFRRRMARALTASCAGPGLVLLICSLYLKSSASSFFIFSSTVSPLLFICTTTKTSSYKHGCRPRHYIYLVAFHPLPLGLAPPLVYPQIELLGLYLREIRNKNSCSNSRLIVCTKTKQEEEEEQGEETNPFRGLLHCRSRSLILLRTEDTLHRY